MEGQDQISAASAQSQKFQRYRSVRRAPKQNGTENAPAPVNDGFVKSMPIRVRGTVDASKASEIAAPSRQKHVHSAQATAVKSLSENDRNKRARPQGITQAPANYSWGEMVEREVTTGPAAGGDELERIEHTASAKVPPSQIRRPREEHVAPREENKTDRSQPGFDAPKSAVNAGDRHVYVTYNKSTIAFPVIPSTIALDLIHAAAVAMPLEKLDPTTAVLWEDYRPYLLERPLRRYETIREVMNSWDGDEQNKFFLTPSQSGKLDESLDIQYAPAHQPGDSTYYMYHTHKNARWSKRVVTIHADGQVTINKEGAKEKDQQNICHLSDFDIYHISPRYKKVIRPPRPICFGVKSQQKRAVFHLNEDNFMQFFSTKDERLAKSFYQDVQRWRSWHLVHVMGKTQKLQPAETAESSPQSTSTQRHQKRASINLAGNGIGSLNPLISTSKSKWSDVEQAKTVNSTARSSLEGEDRHGEHHKMNGLRQAIRPKTQPPVSFPKKLTKDPRTGAPTGQRRYSMSHEIAREVEPEPFASSSLLGNQYQERAQAQQQRAPASPAALVPQQTSHTISQHSNTSPTRAASIRTTRPSAYRSSSSRKGSPPLHLPKPLVDLTPKFYEAPQHVKRERRMLPERLPSSGLVDIATTPEVAINIPSATAWKRPGGTNTESTATKPPSEQIHRPPRDETNGQASSHGRSNSRVRHRQTISGERPDHLPTHPLQRSPVKSAPTIPQPAIPSKYKAPAVPTTASGGQPLGRRGTFKMVGGTVNKSARKDDLGSRAFP